MGFFSTLDGKDVRQNASGSYETANNNDVIPKDTRVKAVIDEIEWSAVPDESDNDAGVAYINVRYSILAPEEFKNRKIFQKLFVSSVGKPSAKDAEKKRTNDLTLLAAINVNSNGQPLNNCTSAPTDAELSSLIGTILLLQLDVWEIGDRKGNWIRSLEGATATKATVYGKLASKPSAKPANKTAPVSAKEPDKEQELPEINDIDDEIPF